MGNPDSYKSIPAGSQKYFLAKRKQAINFTALLLCQSSVPLFSAYLNFRLAFFNYTSNKLFFDITFIYLILWCNSDFLLNEVVVKGHSSILYLSPKHNHSWKLKLARAGMHIKQRKCYKVVLQNTPAHQSISHRLMNPVFTTQVTAFQKL